MSNTPSFEKINYMLRSNKQIERKMIIDLLATINLDIPVSKYHYVGMGSIYYYDYILLHKHLNIRKMTSVDNKDCINRFQFNKPYDFVNFENCSTSNYLYQHVFKQRSLFWLDYDESITGNEYLKEDISVLGKNCGDGDMYIVTVNCSAPVKDEGKNEFLKEFQQYIPGRLNDIKNIVPGKFSFVVQEIILNMLAENCEYNENKFQKLSSFVYKDGAQMYTLCGIFLKDIDAFLAKQTITDFLHLERESITSIKVPHLTYKEKFYMDENISNIGHLLQYAREYWENKDVDSITFDKEMNKFLTGELKFELSHKDVSDYITNYRFVPQYYETVI